MTSTDVKISGQAKGPTLSVVLAGLVVLAVVAISFLPSEDKHVLHTRGKYHSWGHLVVFAVVAFLVARTSRSKMARVLLFFASIAFGFGIEFFEHTVFMSPIEWKDVVVDTLGVLCGTVLAVLTTPAKYADDGRIQ